MSNNSDSGQVSVDSNDLTTPSEGASLVESESLQVPDPAAKSTTTSSDSDPDLFQSKQDIIDKGNDGGKANGAIFNRSDKRYAESEKDSDDSDDSDEEGQEENEYGDEVSSLLSFNNNILLEEVEDLAIGLGHDFSKCICCTDKEEVEVPYVRHRRKGPGRKFNKSQDGNFRDNDNESAGSGIDDFSDYYNLKDQYNEEEIYNFFSSAFENLEINDDKEEEEEGNREQGLQIEEIDEEEEEQEVVEGEITSQPQDPQDSSIVALNQYTKEELPLSSLHQDGSTEQQQGQALEHLEQLELQNTLNLLIGEELGTELDQWYSDNYDAPSDLIALTPQDYQNFFDQHFFEEDSDSNEVTDITAAGTITTTAETFTSQDNWKQGEEEEVEEETFLDSAFSQLSLNPEQLAAQFLYQEEEKRRRKSKESRKKSLLSFVLPTNMFCQPCREDDDDDDGNSKAQEEHPSPDDSGGLGQDEETKWNAEHDDRLANTNELQNQERSEYHQQQSRIHHNSSYSANGTSTNANIRGKPDQMVYEQQRRDRSTEEEQRRQQQEQQQRQIHDQNSMAQQQQPQSMQMNQREKSLMIAEPMKKAFRSSKKNERQCYGHKETIYGLSFSPCGTYCASASQDSTVCIWNVKKNSLVQTLKGHDKENECLRVVWSSLFWGENNIGDKPSLTLATGGADGIVNVWKRKNEEGKWVCEAKLDHTNLTKKNELDENPATEKSNSQQNDDEEDSKEDGEDDDVPQIYAIQFIDDWRGLPPIRSDHNGSVTKLSVLITSSDDYIHLWQLMSDKDDQIKLDNMMDIRFTHLDQGYGGAFVHFHNESPDNTESNTKAKLTQKTKIISKKTAYGGERNPDNLVFVFDASHCQANDLLGVALSDGTLRLVNGRGVCVSILQLPGCESHLTSFAWDASGTRLASCVATGHVILWQLYSADGNNVIPSCQAVLEGGHAQQRPLYGAKYCGGLDQNLLLTWGVDGSLCLWDSYADGQIGVPLAILLSNSDYPIYAVDVLESNRNRSDVSNCVAVAGGREAGFLGMPLSLYNFGKLETGTNM